MATNHFTRSAETATEAEKLSAWMEELHVISESLEFMATVFPEQPSGMAGMLGLIQARLHEQLGVGEVLLHL